MERQALRTPLCNHLGIEYPICLAGMGGRGKSTPPKLVAAVSNAGGLGVIGGSGLDLEDLRSCIQEVRSLTDKPFGVDLLLPVSLAETADTRPAVREQLRREYPKHVAFVQSLMREFDLPDVFTERKRLVTRKNVQEAVEVVLEEKVPVFAAALGDPSWVVPMAREQGITVFGMAGSVRHARRQMEAGVDIVVAQGYEAGGHTGRVANFPLIPQVVDVVAPMPVIAAGGIGDGRGVAAALALGAAGAWVGTAFLVSKECEIPDLHKEDILRGASEDFPTSRSSTGKPVRQFKNVVMEAWENSDLDPLPMPLQGALMEDLVDAAHKAGRNDLINNPAGQISGLLKESKPAATIMDELVQGALEALQRLQGFVALA
jgi:NAD(P)H-dependent flavin oxidoreductase YrpB (nitropropane dioxygenase family)